MDFGLSTPAFAAVASELASRVGVVTREDELEEPAAPRDWRSSLEAACAARGLVLRWSTCTPVAAASRASRHRPCLTLAPDRYGHLRWWVLEGTSVDAVHVGQLGRGGVQRWRRRRLERELGVQPMAWATPRPWPETGHAVLRELIAERVGRVLALVAVAAALGLACSAPAAWLALGDGDWTSLARPGLLAGWAVAVLGLWSLLASGAAALARRAEELLGWADELWAPHLPMGLAGQVGVVEARRVRSALRRSGPALASALLAVAVAMWTVLVAFAVHPGLGLGLLLVLAGLGALVGRGLGRARGAWRASRGASERRLHWELAHAGRSSLRVGSLALRHEAVRAPVDAGGWQDVGLAWALANGALIGVLWLGSAWGALSDARALAGALAVLACGVAVGLALAHLDSVAWLAHALERARPRPALVDRGRHRPGRGPVRVELVGVLCEGVGVDLDLPAGGRLAVRGGREPSRRALAEVLLGLRSPEAGVVRWDGVDARYAPPGALRREAAWLVDEALLPGTLRENLAVGRVEVDEQRQRQALHKVGLGELAAHLDTPVAALGCERRPLLVARVLAGAPRLVVVDGFFDGMARDEAVTLLGALLAEPAHSVVLLTEDRVLSRALDRELVLGEPRATG